MFLYVGLESGLPKRTLRSRKKKVKELIEKLERYRSKFKTKKVTGK